MGLGPTYMLLNFESNLDHRLDDKKYQRSRFSHLLIYTHLDEGMQSLTGLVLKIISKKKTKIFYGKFLE